MLLGIAKVDSVETPLRWEFEFGQKKLEKINAYNSVAVKFQEDNSYKVR